MSPASGTTITLGEEVNLSIEARDEKGVKEIECLANSQAIAQTSSENPAGDASLILNETWKPAAAGQYVLVAWAVDDKGATSNSSPVTVVVQDEQQPTPVPLPSVTPQPTVIIVVPTPVSPERPKEEQIAPIWQKLAEDWAAENWPSVIQDVEQIIAIDPGYDDVTTSSTPLTSTTGMRCSNKATRTVRFRSSRLHWR